MSVYVDEARYRYGRMIMCHMLADTPEELHAMADRIGVARRWYQRHASTPHYDIAKNKRALAVAAGALEVDRRGTAEVILRIRHAILSRTAQGRAWLEDLRPTGRACPYGSTAGPGAPEHARAAGASSSRTSV